MPSPKVTKVNHDKNVWFANEKPSWVEKLLAKLFRVRIIPQKCDRCGGKCRNPDWHENMSIFLIPCPKCHGKGRLLYLRRFYLSPRWKWLPFKLFLHHILLSDTDLAEHDHPFQFRTTILKGSYVQYMKCTTCRLPCLLDRVDTSKFMDSARYPAEHIHRLDIIKPVWSFVIAGKTTREWGFHTANGWKIWHDFLGLTEYNVYPEDEI